MTVVRVMTWNVLGSAKPDLGAIAAAINTHAPDVVALQEVQRGQARRIARHLGFNHRWALKHFPYGVFMWWRAEGLAVLTPHPLDARQRYLLSPRVHSWTYRRRVALRVRINLQGQHLRIFDVHLASHAVPQERVDQATILAGFVAAERQRAVFAGDPYRAIVVGDLNADGEPAVLAPLEAAGFVDAWTIAERRPEGSGATAPSDEPLRRIDYVLVEEGDACLTMVVAAPSDHPRSLSDHLPVVATVELADQIRSK